MLRTHKHVFLMIAPDMFYLAWSEERRWRSYLKFLHMPQTQAKSSERAHVDRRGSSPPWEPGATGLFTSTEKPCTCLWLFFSFSLKFPNLNMTLLSGVSSSRTPSYLLFLMICILKGIIKNGIENVTVRKWDGCSAMQLEFRNCRNCMQVPSFAPL